MKIFIHSGIYNLKRSWSNCLFLLKTCLSLFIYILACSGAKAGNSYSDLPACYKPDSIKASKTMDWDWSSSPEGSGISYATRICLDTNKNAYVYGYFNGQMIMGNDTFYSAGEKDLYIVKYNQKGDILWANQLSSEYYLTGSDLTVDKKGNVYITGYFTDNVSIEGNLLTTDRITEGFLAKYSTEGNLIWIKQLNSGRTINCMAIDTDSSDNIYLGGNFTVSVSLGSKTATSQWDEYSQVMFYARFDTSGNCSWIITAVMTIGMDMFGFVDMTVQPDGNGYLTGTICSVSDFGNGIVLDPGMEAPFIVKYNNSGKCLWGRTIDYSFPGFGESFDISADQSGYLYLTGMYLVQLIFEEDTLSAQPDRMEEIFLARFDTSGNYHGVKSFGSLGEGGDFGLNYQGNSVGEGYLLGLFGDTLVKGADTLIAEKSESMYVSSNIFISKFDSSGAPVWLKSAGLIGERHFGEILISEDDDIFIAGYTMEPETGKKSDAPPRKAFVAMKTGEDTTSTTPVYTDINYAICYGDSIYVEDEWISTTGTYFDYYLQVSGGDSIVRSHIHVYPVYAIENQYSICEGDSLLAGGCYQKATGVYYDTLATAYGCDSVLITNLLVETCTGIYRQIPCNFRIFPNPVMNVLNIEYQPDEKYLVQIIDLMGRIKYYDIKSGSSAINVTNYPAGLYNIILKNERTDDHAIIRLIIL